MPEAGAVRADRTVAEPGGETSEVGTDVGAPAVLLVVVVGVGCFAAGGYHAGAQAILAVLLAALAALLCVSGRRPSTRGGRSLRSAVLVLAGWVVLAGTLTGSSRGALAPLSILAGVAVAGSTSARLSGRQRTLVEDGLLLIGIGVALSGIIGVGLHLEPWGHPTPVMWRASTTLTYPNAAAAVLAALVLHLTARHCRGGSVPLHRIAASVMLLGVLATVSRAGIVLLGVGSVLLARHFGPGRVARWLLWPIVGASVGFVGLLPSMLGATPRPAWAMLGMAGGLVLAFRPLPARPAVATAAIGLVAAIGLGVAITAGPAHEWRTSFEHRQNAWNAAAGEVRSSPIVGAGVNRAELRWVEPDGSALRMRYAHNEYLQTAAEIGLVGLVLLAAASVALWRVVPSGVGRILLVVAALHSAVDFLWHLPAVPLLLAAVIGLSASSPHTPHVKEHRPC